MWTSYTKVGWMRIFCSMTKKILDFLSNNFYFEFFYSNLFDIFWHYRIQFFFILTRYELWWYIMTYFILSFRSERTKRNIKW
jgi:hypothetical protein